MSQVDLKELGAALDRLGSQVLPALMREVREGASLAIWHSLASKSPVGHAYPGGRFDPHPGKYRASHTFTADPSEFKELPDAPAYGIPGDDEPLAVLAATPLEDPVYAGNRVPASDKRPETYAGALEAGHSPQAEGGVYGPTVEEVGGQLEGIGEAAVQKIEGMI